jgi:hypothetical protein
MKIFGQSLLMFLILNSVLSVSGNSQSKNRTEAFTDRHSEDYVGPIIDMHVHAFAEGHPMFGMTHPPTLRGETYEGVISATEQKEKTFEKFRKYNIVKAMVANGDLWFDDAPETILIGGANKGVDELRIQHEKGQLQVIAEMAPFYAGLLADDASLLPYYELAQELDIPVGLHVFPGGPNYGIHLMPEMLGGMRAYNANPLQLEDVLVKFPNLKVYIMHGGWPYVEDIKALMYAHPNVYIDIAVVNWILPQEELNAYLKSLINASFGDRIMFGSDQMVWPQIIDVAVESVNSADFLTLEQKEDIFYDNAAKFLGLTEDEIKKHKDQ